MRFFVGVTDTGWYDFLRRIQPEDINFWQPGGGHQFKAVQQGAPFLFKLKAPHNAIGGLGFFSAAAVQPLVAAWEFFGPGNGCATLPEFRRIIAQYKARSGVADALRLDIGCIILTDPVFFSQEDWIYDIPDWHASIVQGKSYDDTTPSGAALWDQVTQRLRKYRFYERREDMHSGLLPSPDDQRYRDTVARVRVGQGAFRFLVARAYRYACAITGDHTLPVLEAAHIKPYAESGPHRVSNGLLLRSDLHRLFDSGYLTVTPQMFVEVSPRIRTEFNNGKIYYALHGKHLEAGFVSPADRPDPSFLSWHCEHVFKAG